jgi:diacylglycerol O-acyltransferase
VDRLSTLDAWWLHLEREAQQLHVGSALIFQGPPPSQAQLASAIESRLDLVPRYRQRVQQVPLELGRPVWVDDPRFCIDDHVRHATVPSPGTEQSLRDWVARLMSEHLDLSRPPRESWLVDGLEGGRWAMVKQDPPPMIDGVSGADILGVLLDRDTRPALRPGCLVGTTPRALAAPPGRVRPGRHDPQPLEAGQVLARVVRGPRRFTRQTVASCAASPGSGRR